ncbi:type II toxin-antitoxin system HigB family toxin [Paraburkholderia sp. BL10I2N1]|uniref:type II toxin-antitoxin system HigB family toxin n=1 Tax=Paraburkholderia sp. BL10I2N1 TaxID=1938796 RepID=UPI0032615B47
MLSWHEEATKVEWTTPQDIKARYPTASFVGKNRVVFNIKGNDYRLFVGIASESVSSISNLSASARSIRKSTPLAAMAVGGLLTGEQRNGRNRPQSDVHMRHRSDVHASAPLRNRPPDHQMRMLLHRPYLPFAAP